MKQRVVITGAAGFIGSHLSETLLDRGYEVVGVDNLLTGDTANIAHLVNRDFTFISLDLTRQDLHESGFSSAIGANQAIAIARIEFDRDMVEKNFFAELKGDVFSRNHSISLGKLTI